MNRALFSTHCYLSWGFVAPYIMSGIHLAAALRLHSKGYSFDEAVLPSTGEYTCHLVSKRDRIVYDNSVCGALL